MKLYISQDDLGILAFQIIVTIMFAVATAGIDWMHIKKKEWITEKRERVLQRGIFFLSTSLASIPFIDAIFIGAIFASLFDPMLNQMRSLSFFYTGDPNKAQKGWDGLMTKIKNKNKWLILVVRVILFSGGVVGLIFSKLLYEYY